VVKIDDYYRDELLMELERHPQDNVPARRARQTAQLLRGETPEFTAFDIWPPNSPDLSRLITAFDIDAGTSLPHAVTRCGGPRQRLMSVVDEAIDQWREIRYISSCRMRSFRTVAVTMLVARFVVTALNDTSSQ